MRNALFALAIMTPVAAFWAPAEAGDVQGDAYDCRELWVLRNQIYKNAGYCFATEKARSFFGNGGCRFRDQNAVPLSRQDRNILREIRASERRQGC